MRFDRFRWEKGYGWAWKKCRGQADERPVRNGVDASFDAGAAEAQRDYLGILQARELGVRPHGDLRRPGARL